MMKFSSVSNIGKIREINEDSYDNISIADYDFFIVADGMGGHSDGELASSLACKSFIEFIKTEKLDDYVNILDFQESAIYAANDEVYDLATNKNEKMGTTVVCCCIDYKNNAYHLSHIGDSRIYLYRQGNLTQLTKDHSLVNELIERGALRAEEAENFANKSAVTRAVGVSPIAMADHNNLEIQEGDVMLLATDGLTNELTDEEISKIISENEDVYDLSQKLVEAALEAGGKDNITVTTIRM